MSTGKNEQTITARTSFFAGYILIFVLMFKEKIIQSENVDA